MMLHQQTPPPKPKQWEKWGLGPSPRTTPFAFCLMRLGLRRFSPVSILISFALCGGWGPAQAADALQKPATEALVTNQGSDSLSFVDLATFKSVAEIKIGGKPAGIAVSADGLQAYVTSPDGKSVAVVDTKARTVIRRIPVEGGPLGIAANPRTGQVYVADWYSRRVTALDPASGTTIGFADVGSSPSGIAVTADGALVLTADRDSDQVSIIDAATLKPLTAVPVGQRPFGITIDPDGARAFTANVGSDDVSVIDLKSRTVTGRVPVGHHPYAIAFAGGHGFVTNQSSGTVTVFNAATLAVETTIEVGDTPEGINADPSVTYVYVACWFANALQRIDVATLKIAGEATVGDAPRAFGNFLR